MKMINPNPNKSDKLTHNYFWDDKDPSKPFLYAVMCNNYTVVPSNATRICPDFYREDLIPCWDGEKWYTKYDWRKITVWEKATGKKTHYPTVDMKMEDADKYTEVEPKYPFVYWENNDWVRDTKTEAAYNCEQLRAKRKELLEVAKEQISFLDDIVTWKEVEEEDDYQEYSDLLKSWRLYRGRLATMKFVTGEEILPKPPRKVEHSLDI